MRNSILQKVVYVTTHQRGMLQNALKSLDNSEIPLNFQHFDAENYSSQLCHTFWTSSSSSMMSMSFSIRAACSGFRDW